VLLLLDDPGTLPDALVNTSCVAGEFSECFSFFMTASIEGDSCKSIDSTKSGAPAKTRYHKVHIRLNESAP